LFFRPLPPKKLKTTIVDLGASFIKLAQVLATRADFFSQEYLDELKELHDQIPQMDHTSFQCVFKEAFGDGEVFKSFENTPIASASIGQVHKAYLQDGTLVAVKLRRKGIKARVIADTKIIRWFHTLFSPLFSFYTKNSIDAVVNEFSKMILQEVDFHVELENLKKFSTLYADEGIGFPTPYPKVCSSDAIVMSFEEGFRFDDKQSILEHNIDFNEVIAQLVDFYTKQMLLNGYFHADPHPGNILITKESKIIFLDFGMVKTVPNDKRVAIIELIKAANEQNYEAYISASKRLGTIAYEAPVDELAEFTASMFDIFSNENLDSASMQKLAFDVLSRTRNLPFKLPSDAIYILRVSAIIEGLGTTYIENFNGVKDILPILQDNIPNALGAGESVAESVVSEFKDLPFFIKDFKTFVKKGSEGSLEVELSQSQLEFFAKSFKDFARPIIFGTVLVVSSFFMLLYDKEFKTYALVLFVAGVLRLLYR